MCGIAGFSLIPNARLEEWHVRLKSFASKLSHRGPDNAGFALWDGKGNYDLHPDETTLVAAAAQQPRLGLMHRRLSIIDTAARSHQPMATANGRYLLIYNGEIYNYIELREQLEREGYHFQTSSDTEVFLNALVAWGPKMACARAIGMFAFCLVDKHEGHVVLGRDTYGIKPLFYARPQNGLVFASEIKALLDWPGIGRKANPSTVRSYLAMGLVNYDDSSFFQDISSVPPGHCIWFSIENPHNLKSVCFKPDQPDRLKPTDLSKAEATAHLRKLFLDSVQLHMRSDVGYGALLSGGLDSSAIVGAMHETDHGPPIQCYSYVSPGDHCDEAHWASMVSDRHNCELRKIHSGAKDLFRDIDDLVALQDEPFGSTSIYAQYCIFRAIKADHQTVVLDGQGADEIFAGYLPYYTAHIASLIRHGNLGQAAQMLNNLAKHDQGSRKNLVLRSIARLMPEGIGALIHHYHAHHGQRNTVNWSWFETVGACAHYNPVSGLQDNLSDTLHLDLVRNNLPGLLRYEDRNSMHFSVESRVPYLSQPLVDFVQTLPESWLIDRNGRNKAIFRDAVSDLVPEPILARRDKIGFATPESRWFSESYEATDSLLQTAADLDIPFLNISSARKHLSENIHSNQGFDRQVWRWINLAMWTRKFSVQYS